MIETSKRKHRYRHITRSQKAQHNTDTHTEANKRLRARDMIQGEIILQPGRSWLKAF